jgi:hypothetical protein
VTTPQRLYVPRINALQHCCGILTWRRTTHQGQSLPSTELSCGQKVLHFIEGWFIKAASGAAEGS